MLSISYFMKSDEIMDKEADMFARCLLMPKPLIIEYTNQFKAQNPITTEEVVTKMAKIFQVTELQMALRMKELKLINY